MGQAFRAESVEQRQRIVGSRDQPVEQGGFQGQRLGPGRVERAVGKAVKAGRKVGARSEEHTSELQSLMRISYAVFCLKKKKQINQTRIQSHTVKRNISQTN